MFSFLVPAYRVIHGFWASWDNRAFRYTTGAILLLLASGTWFYTQVEGWRAIDALYFSFVTLTTIGYGDLAPKSDAAKIFTMFYAAAGIGLFLKIIQTIAQPTVTGGTEERKE
ncbi:MAG: potassium channel family protein [Rhizobiaceae bacterium]